MALDPSIFSNVGANVTPILNPLDIQAKKIAIQNALANNGLLGQEQQKNALAIQQAQLAMSDQASVDAAMKDWRLNPPASPVANPAALANTAPAPAPGGGLPFDASTGLAADPTGGALSQAAGTPPAVPAVPPRPAVPTLDYLLSRGVRYGAAQQMITQFQNIEKTSAEIEDKRASATKADKEANDLVAQQAAEMADGIVKNTPDGQPVNPELLNWHLQHFASLGPQEAQQAQAVGAHLSQLAPADQITFLKTLANTPKQVDANSKASDAATAASRLKLETPGLTTNQNGLTPQQQSNADLRAREIAKLNTPAELALIASKPGPDQAAAKAALELLKQNNIEERKASAQAQAPVVITPAGYNLLGQQFQTTGQLPTIPRGPGAAVAAKVINDTAAANPQFNAGVAKADYKANVGSLDSMQKQRDAVVTFEKTAGANIDTFLKLAAKQSDIGVPILNGKIRMLNDKVLGAEWAPAIQAGRQIAVNEIAKVTSNPTLSGALSDSARHEVSEYNPADATLAQTLHVAQVLRNDMENRKKFFDEGIAEIKGRIAGGSGSSASSSSGSTDLQHKSTDELLNMLTKGK